MYTRFRLVFDGEEFCNLLHSVSLYQIDGATSEPAAGHPCTVNFRSLRSDLYQQIQLRAAHFIIVTQTDVRLAHQLSKALNVALLQCRGSIRDTLNFRDHVAAPAIENFRQLAGALRDLFRRNV